MADEEIHPASAEVRARWRRLTDETRRRHDALDAAIEALERALAAAGGRRARAWTERVAVRLELVREAIRAHAEDVEAPGGLFHELVEEDPRLDRRVADLRGAHDELRDRATSLAMRLQPERETDVAGARREAAGLLAELRAHRAAEADLIYEAFWTDLGAPD
jgi:hypothetical protein